MDIESLRSIVEAYEYSTNWERILNEYYAYFKEIEQYFPKNFVNHFSKNNHYHDWLLQNILVCNENANTKRPTLIIQLSNKDSVVSLRFENVLALHMEGDYTRRYAGHMDLLDMCAFLRQDEHFSFHCSFVFGLKILVTYKKLHWSIKKA